MYAAEVNVVLARRACWPRSLNPPPLTEADRRAFSLRARGGAASGAAYVPAHDPERANGLRRALSNAGVSSSACTRRDHARRRLAHHGAADWLAPVSRRRRPGEACRSLGAATTIRAGRVSTSTVFDRAHADPEYRAEDESQIMLRKNFLATGSFIERRPSARARAARVREPARVRHVHELARAAHRTRGRPGAGGRGRARRSTAPCSTGARSTRGCCRSCVVPLGDMPAAVALAREAIDGGAAAIQIGQYCPPGHSPSAHRPRTAVGDVPKRPACRSCCTSPARART